MRAEAGRHEGEHNTLIGRTPFKYLTMATRWRHAARDVGIAVLCLEMLSCWTMVAQQRPPEYAVKAAYLYNFGKFAKWPEAVSTFNICVLGKDPFDGTLDHTVAGESIDGKPIAVRRLPDLSQAHDCQILFLSSSERSRMRALLAELQNLPILTVSDVPDFIDKGGMIQFELQNDRVRFSINLRSAREAKLNISSDLLSVASKVEGK